MFKLTNPLMPLPIELAIETEDFPSYTTEKYGVDWSKMSSDDTSELVKLPWPTRMAIVLEEELHGLFMSMLRKHYPEVESMRYNNCPEFINGRIDGAANVVTDLFVPQYAFKGGYDEPDEVVDRDGVLWNLYKNVRFGDILELVFALHSIALVRAGMSDEENEALSEFVLSFFEGSEDNFLRAVDTSQHRDKIVQFLKGKTE